MKNIVVPTDFSAHAAVAVNMACQLAQKSGAHLHLIHVTELAAFQYHNSAVLMKAIGDPMASPYLTNLIDVLQHELLALQHQCEQTVATVSRRVLVGNAYQKIRSYCESVSADLLVMGAKGEANLRDLFLGSLTDKIIRSFHLPVLTTKELSGFYQLRQLVFATDLELIHQPMMELLAHWQTLFGCHIHLLKVKTPQQTRSVEETHAALVRLAQKFHLQEYTTHNYAHEDEEYGIVQFAEAHNIDLIAMGVHERSGFRRLISGGSMVEEVSDHSKRPVLTLQIPRN